MPKSVTELKASIVNKSATVGVIGLGYVGVPLIRAFVQAGFRTMGLISIRPKSIDCLPWPQSRRNVSGGAFDVAQIGIAAIGERRRHAY